MHSFQANYGKDGIKQEKHGIQEGKNSAQERSTREYDDDACAADVERNMSRLKQEYANAQE